MKISTDECWLYAGPVNWQGYGQISIGDNSVVAHRVMYENFVGKIPPKYEIDHLCRVTTCINPAHLEAVTHAENCRRATHPWGERTACASGHEYTPDNLYIRISTRADGSKYRVRGCIKCTRIHQKRYRTRLKVERSANG